MKRIPGLGMAARIFFVAILPALSSPAMGQSFKLFLVGDAGEDTKTGETLRNLGLQLVANPNSAVIFLGDNCYKSGLGDILPYGFKGFDSSTNTIQKMHSQLDILQNYRGYVFFVPGNHDWWNITNVQKGRPKLKMEQSFVEANLGKNQTISNPGHVFFPQNGDPGPATVVLPGDSVRLIFIDTYRLIIESYKSKDKEEGPVERGFYHRLDSMVLDARGRHQRLIVAAHHTLYAKGPNSKPLANPYLFARIKASNSNFPSYNTMREKIRAVLVQYPGCYYACGHIHSLQYFFPPDSVHYIVSGAGSKTVYVSAKNMEKNKPGPGKESLVWNSKGFFEIDFYRPQDQIWMYSDNGKKKSAIP